MLKSLVRSVLVCHVTEVKGDMLPSPGMLVIKFLLFVEEKETEENKELTDACKDRENDTVKKKVEHEISEGNVATAAAAALASAATKAKVRLQPFQDSPAL